MLLHLKIALSVALLVPGIGFGAGLEQFRVSVGFYDHQGRPSTLWGTIERDTRGQASLVFTERPNHWLLRPFARKHRIHLAQYAQEIDPTTLVAEHVKTILETREPTVITSDGKSRRLSVTPDRPVIQFRVSHVGADVYGIETMSLAVTDPSTIETRHIEIRNIQPGTPYPKPKASTPLATLCGNLLKRMIGVSR